MFQTSQDVLYLVLSGAIAILAVLLAWLIIECALLLRGAHRVVREMRQKIVRIEAVLSGIRDKIEHSASYLHLLAEAIKQIVAFFIDKRGQGGKKKK